MLVACCATTLGCIDLASGVRRERRLVLAHRGELASIQGCGVLQKRRVAPSRNLGLVDARTAHARHRIPLRWTGCRRVCAAIGGRRRVGAAARDNEKESCDRRSCSRHGSKSTAHHGYRDAAEPPWTFRPHLLRHHPLAFASDVLRVWGASKQHVGDARGRLHKQQERPGSARRLRLCFGACRSHLLMRFARGCSGCWRTWMRTWVSR